MARGDDQAPGYDARKRWSAVQVKLVEVAKSHDRDERDEHETEHEHQPRLGPCADEKDADEPRSCGEEACADESGGDRNLDRPSKAIARVRREDEEKDTREDDEREEEARYEPCVTVGTARANRAEA